MEGFRFNDPLLAEIERNFAMPSAVSRVIGVAGQSAFLPHISHAGEHRESEIGHLIGSQSSCLDSIPCEESERGSMCT